MLEIAFVHQDALNKAWQRCIHNERFKFYNFGSHFGYEIKCSDSTWDCLQMVSVNKTGDIIGYLSASLDRANDKVSAIGALNFFDINLTFSKDFRNFLDELFTVHRFRKIEWFVVVGNPAEAMYDKIVKKYGGRITGLERESVRLYDGAYYDVKSYELFNRDYSQR